MKVRLNLVCDPFEAGRSGTSRYMSSLFSQLKKPGLNLDYEVAAYSRDESFLKKFPEAKNTTNFKSDKSSLVHFLSERRVGPVAGRFVVTCHDLFPQKKPYRYGRLRALYHKYYVNFFLRKADAVICPSLATKNDLISIAKVDASRIHVIRHAIDSKIFYPDQEKNVAFEDLLQKHEVSEDFAVCISRIEHPGKSLDFALKAFSDFSKREPSRKIDLLLIGADWNGSEIIRHMVTELNLAPRVKFLGHLSEDLLRKFISQASFAFAPSVNEGFALPVLEYLACGTHVLLPSVPPLNEFSEDGLYFYDSSSFADCALKMSEILLHPSSQKRSLIDLEQWSWARVASETLEVYKSLRL